MKKTHRRTVPSANDQQNIKLSKQLTCSSITNKICTEDIDIEKFGKSIRAKALPKYDSTAPLKQTRIDYNNIRRKSQNLADQKPHIEDIDNMSISFISHTEERNTQFDQIPHSQLFRRKNVKFCDYEQSQQSMSKSRSSRKSSILKNSSFDKQSNISFTSHVGSICGGLTAKASVKDKGINCQNKNYQSTLKQLIKNDNKYFDKMFPPGETSLFFSKKLSKNIYQDIRWMRLNQIFPGKKMVLKSQQDRNQIKIGNFWELDYMATAFNAIGTSQRCIEKIFQNQKFSKYGIYYLRLNHEGIWKYVVVDDYIPVKKAGKVFIPAFLHINPSNSQYIQLWPFLLQKALAKMYSTYESLMQDQFQNCMYQLTGVLPITYTLNDHNFYKSALNLKIRNHLQNPDNIMVASMPVKTSKYQERLYPFFKSNQNSQNTFAQNSRVKLLSCNSGTTEEYYQNLSDNFAQIKAYIFDDSFCSVGCIIKQQKSSISLRKFTVSDNFTECTLSLIQKDRKYYRNNGYQYSFMRLILVQKDIDGYRYIDGLYSQQKVISLRCQLQHGQYYVIVIGQWHKKIFDITLNYQGTAQIQFMRQPLDKHKNIVSQTCGDMAQRWGTFRQINKNICSYQHIDRQNGFIIQNFNNQLDRQVYLHRQYKIPFNNFKLIGQINFKQGQQIQQFIKPQSNLTLIIMLENGVKQQQLQHFRF